LAKSTWRTLEVISQVSDAARIGRWRSQITTLAPAKTNLWFLTNQHAWQPARLKRARMAIQTPPSNTKH
jgi:hypothetical protein